MVLMKLKFYESEVMWVNMCFLLKRKQIAIKIICNKIGLLLCHSHIELRLG